MRPYRHGTVASETEPSGVYDQPGLELGCGIALPLVTLTALVGIRFVIVGDRLYVLGGTATHQCPSDMAGFVGSFDVKGQ
jgi:hypothetical protein